MGTYLSFEYTHATELPSGHTNEVRTPEVLVEHFLAEYSDPGDRVLDIFAGYGTTLTVAEEMDRVPYGVEYDPERVEYIRTRITSPNHIRVDDVRDLEPAWFPVCDCCFTSPPFMVRSDNRNPFCNYAGESTYEKYLDDIETAFTQLDSVLAAGGHVIVDIANMKNDGQVTPLAWDVAKRISNIFHFEGEVIITWENDKRSNEKDGQFGYGYDHSYCLLFEKDKK